MAITHRFEVPLEEHQNIELDVHKTMFKHMLGEYAKRYPHFKLYYAGINTSVPSEKNMYSYALIFTSINEYKKKIAVVDTVPYGSPRSTTGYRYALRTSKQQSNPKMLNAFFKSFENEAFTIEFSYLEEYIQHELTTPILNLDDVDATERNPSEAALVISQLEKEYLSLDKNSPYYFGKSEYVNTVADGLHFLRSIAKPRSK